MAWVAPNHAASSTDDTQIKDWRQNLSDQIKKDTEERLTYITEADDGNTIPWLKTSTSKTSHELTHITTSCVFGNVSLWRGYIDYDLVCVRGFILDLLNTRTGFSASYERPLNAQETTSIIASGFKTIDD